MNLLSLQQYSLARDRRRRQQKRKESLPLPLIMPAEAQRQELPAAPLPPQQPAEAKPQGKKLVIRFTRRPPAAQQQQDPFEPTQLETLPRVSSQPPSNPNPPPDSSTAWTEEHRGRGSVCLPLLLNE